MARYPIGKQDFKTLRTGGYVYIDKTRYIEKLLEGSQMYFLSRPRRFGKSLFISTLECFFRGEKELFEGLYIDSPRQEWTEYPVIRIDLAAANFREHNALNVHLSAILSRYEKHYGIEREAQDTFSSRFSHLILTAYEKTGKQVVVLVDEYEKPLTDLIDDREQMEECRRVLQGFYSVLKSSDAMLKLVFLTGVTRFGQMSVFSGLNNIRDISLNEEFGAICGVTEQELQDNFKQGIEQLAIARKTDYEGALALLKENYDGYHFCQNCPDIYNPFSLVNALADSSIRPYWSATGTPSLLVQVLLRNKFNLLELDGMAVSEERLGEMDRFFSDPVSLFYQTGYLTIKNYDEDADLYIIGYPNREVEQAFLTHILPYYYSEDTQVASLTDNLKLAVNRGEAEKIMEILEAFSAGISYELIPRDATEKHFQNMIYIVTSLLVSRTVKVSDEQRTSDGRMDVTIETPKFVYIIEIKRDKSASEALQQIIEKQYALKFKADNRKVYLIGVNFSTDTRRIDSYLIKEAF